MNNNESAVKQVKDNSVKKSSTDIEIKNQADQAFGKIKDKISEKLSNLQDKTQVAKKKFLKIFRVRLIKFIKRQIKRKNFWIRKLMILMHLAHQTIEKVNELGHRAGDVLNSSSEYIRNFDAEETRKQVKKQIQNNPGTSLAVAGIFGLLIGLLIGRNNKSR